MSTNKLGISPYNTELVIVFRSNTVDTTNVAANTVNVVNRAQFIYQDITALTNTQRNFLENSLEVNNDNPITSINVDISVDELKQRAKSHYAAQNRAVTKQDYESLVYNMPAKFGAITRANIINDPSATNRKMSLYVISQDSDGNLALAGDVVKNNLKNWINQFRAVNDQIEIMNPKIINFGIDFVVMTDKRFSQNSVLTECVEEIKALFSDKLYIGEPIYLSRIYERMNRIDGVVDVRKVTLYNKNDGSYSSVFLDFDKVLSRDGTYIETPKNAIMELKFPDLDIKGTAK
jgi:phage-related baseplate assembly protein